MANTKHRGFEGFLYFHVGTGTSAKLANITGWELSIKADEIDATDHDSSGWGDKLDGYKNWSVQVSHMYIDGNAGQESLITALTGSADVLVELRPVDATGQANWTGTARITDYKETAKGAAAQVKDITLSGRGALTRGTVGS